MRNLGPEYSINQNTIMYPHVNDAVLSGQPITGNTISGLEYYDMRQTPSQLSFGNKGLILPRDISKDYLKYLATQSGHTFCDIQKRLRTVPPSKDRSSYIRSVQSEIYNLLEEFGGNAQLISFMYDGISKEIGDSWASDGLVVPNKDNTDLVLEMNDKHIAKKVWMEKGMTVSGLFLDLSDPDALLHLQKYATLHPDGFALKTAMSFSGVGVSLCKKNNGVLGVDVGTNPSKFYSLEEYFSVFLLPMKNNFKQILCEPLLPIKEKNIGSVQLYIDESGDISAYKATKQKMNGTAHIGNSLEIELSDPILAQAMKDMAVSYYSVLEDGITKNGRKPYIGDSAIDIALLVNENGLEEKLKSYGMHEKFIKKIYSSDGNEYIVYILENNSRYGGATTVSKTESYLRDNGWLDNNSYLSVENFEKSNLFEGNIIVKQDELINNLCNSGLLFDKNTGLGVVSADIISKDKVVIISALRRDCLEEIDFAVKSKLEGVSSF